MRSLHAADRARRAVRRTRGARGVRYTHENSKRHLTRGASMKLRYKILIAIGVVVALGVLSLALAMSHTSPCGPAPPLAAGATPMKAIVHRCYGSPDVIRLESDPKPMPKDDELLVRVHAASVNPLDW